MAVELGESVHEGLGPDEKRVGSLLSQLQGNILKGHGRDCVLLVFFRFRPGSSRLSRSALQAFCEENLRSCLHQLREQSRYARSNEKLPGEVFVNVFLTAAGYDALEIDKLPPDSKLRLGMKSCGRPLHDPDVSTWEPGFRDPIHGMILFADDDELHLRRTAGSMLERLDERADFFIELGKAMRNENGNPIEHFGYVDGRSQPLFLKMDLEREDFLRGGIDRSQSKSGRIGYDASADLSLVLVKDPGSPLLEAYGSYLVYRKLEQNVRAFKEREAALAAALGLEGEDAERAGALVVGRFEDGTPVEIQSEEGMHSPVWNNFNYDRDALGTKCPIHSHVRRVNARDAAQGDRSHRIVRRGITYGDRPRPPGKEESPEELPTSGVGLHFMCFQADIERQFEHIQRAANDTRCGIDPVIGQASGTRTDFEQSWPRVWAGDAADTRRFDFHGFVRLLGGEYFFAPSLDFLLNLDSPWLGSRPAET